LKNEEQNNGAYTGQSPINQITSPLWLLPVNAGKEFYEGVILAITPLMKTDGERS